MGLAWYRIEIEREACLIWLTMGGFFESEVIVQMRRELVEAIATLSCRPNDHVTLCDIREMDIQSQGRVEEFSKLVGSNDVRSRLLAFVVAKSLSRLQARRLTSREGVDYFTDIEAARNWLQER